MCLISLPNSTHSSASQTMCSVFFRMLTSNVKYKLFNSYCTSYYGCELWSLTTSNISYFCTMWRRGVRSIWNLPYTTHCYLLPLICQCLPVFDELCRRSINFMRSCVSQESKLISKIASHCIHFARCKTPMGLNILFCADRYQTNIMIFLAALLITLFNRITIAL